MARNVAKPHNARCLNACGYPPPRAARTRHTTVTATPTPCAARHQGQNFPMSTACTKTNQHTAPITAPGSGTDRRRPAGVSEAMIPTWTRAPSPATGTPKMTDQREARTSSHEAPPQPAMPAAASDTRHASRKRFKAKPAKARVSRTKSNAHSPAAPRASPAGRLMARRVPLSAA